MEHQPLMAGLPLAQISLSRLARMRRQFLKSMMGPGGIA
jgi:hypothetical protein